MVNHFLNTTPYKMSIFEFKVGNMHFFANFTYLLVRTQDKKFEELILVKIASRPK